MWFKNLAIYRFHSDWRPAAAELEAALERRPLMPCSPVDLLSKGWVAPAATGRLLHTVNLQHLIALGVEQKLLPASVIRQEADRRAAVLAERQGYPVGRRQLRELRMRVGEELRARALTRRRTTRAWLDPAGGWLVVDAASPGKAEELLETLRETLGSLPVRLVDTRHSAHAGMAAWLTSGGAPGRFAIDQDLELQSADATKATVRYTRHPIDLREVRAHLSAGKYPTRLGLTWSERVSFVLTEKLQVKRVEFLDMTRDSADGGESDAAEQFDVDFAVMAGELARLLADLVQALGGENAAQPAAA